MFASFLSEHPRLTLKLVSSCILWKLVPAEISQSVYFCKSPLCLWCGVSWGEGIKLCALVAKFDWPWDTCCWSILVGIVQNILRERLPNTVGRDMLDLKKTLRASVISSTTEEYQCCRIFHFELSWCFLCNSAMSLWLKAVLMFGYWVCPYWLLFSL